LRALSLLPFLGLGFLLSSGGIAGHFLEGGSKVEERLGFGKDNSKMVEGVTKVEVWVGFYRGKTL